MKILEMPRLFLVGVFTALSAVLFASYVTSPQPVPPHKLLFAMLSDAPINNTLIYFNMAEHLLWLQRSF